MARPTVAPPKFRPEVCAQLDVRAIRLGIDPPGILARYFEFAVNHLPGSAMETARFGLGANTWALVTGNYFLAAANNRGFGMAAIDGAEVPSRRGPFRFASAAGPVVFAFYDLEFIGRSLREPEYWRSYSDACAVLVDSVQGRSPHFMTSKVRAPLADALVQAPPIESATEARSERTG